MTVVFLIVVIGRSLKRNPHASVRLRLPEDLRFCAVTIKALHFTVHSLAKHN